MFLSSPASVKRSDSYGSCLIFRCNQNGANRLTKQGFTSLFCSLTPPFRASVLLACSFQGFFPVGYILARREKALGATPLGLPQSNKLMLVLSVFLTISLSEILVPSESLSQRFFPLEKTILSSHSHLSTSISDLRNATNSLVSKSSHASIGLDTSWPMPYHQKLPFGGTAGHLNIKNTHARGVVKKSHRSIAKKETEKHFEPSSNKQHESDSANSSPDTPLLPKGSSCTSPGSVNVLKSPDKPHLSMHDYRAIELSNCLKVLLISAPHAGYAAAAYDDNVGTFANDFGRQGLAHFNEHILFLGNKKYPVENMFMIWLPRHGGTTNAFTTPVDTQYHFSVRNDCLPAALDMFSHFFRDPGISLNSTFREVYAVNAEYSKNILNDDLRIQRMIQLQANPLHPLHKFSTGNLETLLGTSTQILDTSNPKVQKKAENLMKDLIRFYQTHYSSRRSSLVLVGAQNLDELQKLAVEKFEAVRNTNVSKIQDEWTGIPAFQPFHGLAIFEIVPVKPLRELRFVWSIPLEKKKYASMFRIVKPLDYVSSAIKQTGPNSLLAFLKRRALGLKVLTSIDYLFDDVLVFEICVHLTRKGFYQRHFVMTSVFAYIKLLKEHLEARDTRWLRLFDQMQAASERDWWLTNDMQPAQLSSLLATTMHLIEQPEMWLSARIRNFLDMNQTVRKSDKGVVRPATSWSEIGELPVKLTSALLSSFKPSTAYVFHISQEFQRTTTEIEHFYHIRYSQKSPSPNHIQQWHNPPPKLLREMDLPEPSPWFPEELMLKFAPNRTLRRLERSIMTLSEVPEKLNGEDRYWRVMWKPDKKFESPMVYAEFVIRVNSRFTKWTPVNIVLSVLWTEMLKMVMEEKHYSWIFAGYSSSISISNRQIKMHFSGYRQHIHKWVETALHDFINFIPINKKLFRAVKEQQRRRYKGFFKKQPFQQVNYYRNLLLVEDTYEIEQLIEALEKVSYAEFKYYCRMILGHIACSPDSPMLSCVVRSLQQGGLVLGFGEGIIQGNLNKAEAIELWSIVKKMFVFEPMSIKAARVLQVGHREIPPRHTFRWVREGLNPRNRNSAVLLQFQIPTNLEERHPSRRTYRLSVLTQMLASVASQPFFKDLRTKQQLGYIVQINYELFHLIPTVQFLVQSPSFDPLLINSRIEKFIRNFRSEILEHLTPADIEQHKQSLKDQYYEPDATLKDEVNRHAGNIVQATYDFKDKWKRPQALQNITKEDLLNLWDVYLSAGAASRRITAVLIYAKQHAHKFTKPSIGGTTHNDVSPSSVIHLILDSPPVTSNSNPILVTTEKKPFPASNTLKALFTATLPQGSPLRRLFKGQTYLNTTTTSRGRDSRHFSHTKEHTKEGSTYPKEQDIHQTVISIEKDIPHYHTLMHFYPPVISLLEEESVEDQLLDHLAQKKTDEMILAGRALLLDTSDTCGSEGKLPHFDTREQGPGEIGEALASLHSQNS